MVMILRYRTGKKVAPQLQVISVQSTDIPPKENVVYTKQTQTSTSGGVNELRDGKYPFCKHLCERFRCYFTVSKFYGHF